MAGFDSDGHIVRLTFSQDDARLELEGLFIGRDAKTCELHINDSSVSRRHARLFKNQGALWIEDLGSTNGISIHGRMVSKDGAFALPDQGNITLGAVELSIGTY
jgi:pSer/pThr/pTyr-binding forkhead associated (FHA) protein